MASRLANNRSNRVVFGHWGREVPEDVVLCRTGKTVTEIHCHGGEAAAGRIQADVESLGGRRESWPEMLERTEGKFRREWTEAISKATTKRTAGILLRQRELFPKQSTLAKHDWPRPALTFKPFFKDRRFIGVGEVRPASRPALGSCARRAAERGEVEPHQCPGGICPLDCL